MTRRILIAPMLLMGCGLDLMPRPEVEVPPEDPDTCPPMYAQNLVPEYHVEISAGEWAAIEDEFRNREARIAAGLDPTPYHPVEFRYKQGDDTTDPIPGVMMRLKGASSWLEALNWDANPKYQFVIAFNEVYPDMRFKGVRKIELDMPRSDPTFLRQRIGLWFMRKAGLPAQCANNARLYINGDYYGLFTNLERLDKEFLQRTFPEASDGDLWKNGRIIKTNEETFSWARLDALWHLSTVGEMSAMMDVELSLREWAGEVVVGDADGYYNGRANFYLYDHPERGFIWLAHDMDTTMAQEYMRHDASPVFPDCAARWERDWHHYIVAMNDPAVVNHFTEIIADVRSRYDVSAVHARIDAWSAQIRDALEEDPHRPWGLEVTEYSMDAMRAYASDRPSYIDAWLDCRAHGGPDGDGDTWDMCHDCDDANAAVHPGATEACNMRDDNCDGRVDTVDGVSVCG